VSAIGSAEGSPFGAVTRTLVNGLRCTTAERTMRDLAEVLPHVAPLRAIGIDAFRDEVLDLALLHAEVEAMRPGAARDRLAEVAADLARVRTESTFAYEVLEAMAEFGLPVEGEFPWWCPDGRIIHHDGAVLQDMQVAVAAADPSRPRGRAAAAAAVDGGRVSSTAEDRVWCGQDPERTPSWRLLLMSILSGSGQGT
jgi:hypothetical protein